MSSEEWPGTDEVSVYSIGMKGDDEFKVPSYDDRKGNGEVHQLPCLPDRRDLPDVDDLLRFLLPSHAHRHIQGGV